MALLPVTSTLKAPAENLIREVYLNSIYAGREPSRMVVALEPVGDEEYGAAQQA